MTDTEKLAIAIAALREILNDACVCSMDYYSTCRCNAEYDAREALIKLREMKI